MGKFHGRVSTERVVSGKGIVNVYEFLATKFPDEVDATIDAKIRFETEGAMYVSRSSYDNALCERVITLVLDAYGAELGNAAVKWLPFGGLYIAGGIAIKNLDRIRDPDSPFMRAYLDRGRLKTVLDKIPLREPPPKYHPFLHPYPSIPPSIPPSFLQ
jgi:glucokinase